MSKGVEKSRYVVHEVRSSERGYWRKTHLYRVEDTRVSPARQNIVTVRRESPEAALKAGSGIRRRVRLFTGF